MKKTALLLAGFASTFLLGFYTNSGDEKQLEKITATQQKIDNMKLGAFSISLNVKDLTVSKQFYESLGFTKFGGDITQNYVIMKNENSLVGLFQGMFEGNILTFNPGWDENAKNVEKFDDVRAIQKHLKSQGIKLTAEADDNTSGPAFVMLTDPDGNVIYIDQHR